MGITPDFIMSLPSAQECNFAIMALYFLFSGFDRFSSGFFHVSIFFFSLFFDLRRISVNQIQKKWEGWVWFSLIEDAEKAKGWNKHLLWGKRTPENYWREKGCWKPGGSLRFIDIAIVVDIVLVVVVVFVVWWWWLPYAKGTFGKRLPVCNIFVMYVSMER